MRRGNRRTAAETNHKNRKLSVDTLKKQPLLHFVYSPDFLLVVVSFILNAAGLAAINMDDAIKAGGFVKAVFLPVDASVWINNVFGKQDSSGGIIRREENNK
jgi:hypothetical protein